MKRYLLSSNLLIGFIIFTILISFIPSLLFMNEFNVVSNKIDNNYNTTNVELSCRNNHRLFDYPR